MAAERTPHAPRQAGAASPDRAVRRRVLSQNFLVDRQVIDDLVKGSGVAEGSMVMDVGAGNGLITSALAGTGATVIAVERDPVLARKLRTRFADTPAVTVCEGDVLSMPLPREPFQVVANIPFGITTKILRHLLGSPDGTFTGADVIVQAEVARKRGSGGRGTLLNACWEPWYDFATGPKIKATAFRPRPSVDAAVLLIRHRDPPLVSAAARGEYTEFVTQAFTGAHPTVASALSRLAGRTRFAQLAADLGFSADALPGALTVTQWAGLFRALRGGARGAQAPPRRPARPRPGR